MKKMLKKFMLQHGKHLCAIVVAMAGIAPNCCRGHWYQAEEPEGLAEFLKGQKNNSNNYLV